MGPYWNFDTPGSLYVQLRGWFADSFLFAVHDRSNMYAVYSYPNIVLPFLCGVFVDRYLGLYRSAWLFAFLAWLGVVVFCVAVSFKLLPLALLGRFILGLGGESLAVIQGLFMVKWFARRRLPLVFGLVTIPMRVVPSVGIIVGAWLAQTHMVAAIWLGALVASLSLVACGALVALDRRVKPEVAHEVEEVVLTHRLRRMPAEVWLLCIICLCLYVSVLTFGGFAQDIMVNSALHYEAFAADGCMSVAGFTCAVAAPIAGWLIGRTGRSLRWIFAAMSALIVGHLCFLGMVRADAWALSLGPAPVLIWNALAYSVAVAALWPSLSLILERTQLGTGFGLMAAFCNAGMAVVPQIVAAVQEHVDGGSSYVAVMLVFIVIACVAWVVTACLIGVDGAHGARLNAPGA